MTKRTPKPSLTIIAPDPAKGEPGLRRAYLRRGRAAAYIDVAPQTLSNWAQEEPPRGPAFIQVNHSLVLYPVDLLDAYLRSRITYTTDVAPPDQGGQQ